MWTENILKTELFDNDVKCSTNANPKWPVIVTSLNSSGVVLTEIQSEIRFQIPPA